MKKLLFIIFVAMLAACGQQGATSSDLGGKDTTGGAATTGAYSIEMDISNAQLATDTDVSKVVLKVFTTTGQTIKAEDEAVKNITFAVGDGLSYEKNSALEYSVTRRANAKVGDVEVIARMSDGSSATGVIKIIKGSIAFVAPPTTANAKQTISVKVIAKDIGSKDEGRTLVASLNGAAAGAAQITKADGSAEFAITMPDVAEDQEVTLKVADQASGTSSEHKIAVKSLGADSLTLNLIDSTGKAVSFMPAGATDYKIKVTATGGAAGKNVTFVTNQTGSSVSPCAGECAVTAPHKGTVTVTGTVDVNGKKVTGETTFLVSPATATTATLDYNKKISTKSADAKESTYQSRILIKLSDADGTGVAGVKITAVKPSENPGALLNPNSGLLVTDNNGYAEVTYEAPADVPPSGKDYTINFTVDGGGPSIPAATINVQQRQLIVKLLTAGALKEDGPTFLIDPMVLIVTDNNGTAVDGAKIEVSALMHTAYFGCYGAEGEKWQRASAPGPSTGFIAAIKRTGGKIQSMQVGTDSYSPIDPDAALGTSMQIFQAGTQTSASTVSTSNGGTAYIDVRYPRAESGWSVVTLTVTAKRGNEQSSFDQIYSLPVLVDDMKVQETSLLSRFSPHNVWFDVNANGEAFTSNEACVQKSK